MALLFRLQKKNIYIYIQKRTRLPLSSPLKPSIQYSWKWKYSAYCYHTWSRNLNKGVVKSLNLMLTKAENSRHAILRRNCRRRSNCKNTNVDIIISGTSLSPWQNDFNEMFLCPILSTKRLPKTRTTPHIREGKRFVEMEEISDGVRIEFHD
jgi:hypothetical protein